MWLLVLLAMFASGSPITAAERMYYTAAVYEHARFEDKESSPETIISKNLALYRTAAEVAKSKGADIIVFPEYGLFPPSGERKELKPFLETIPDPKRVRLTPCVRPEAFRHSPILLNLSCLAKNHSMFIVANAGDIQDCEGHPDCPSDGVFQYNTNVVFDRNGTLILRYYKEHLFYELGMDLPHEVQNATFETDFGKFATFICFDIDFGRMSHVGRQPDIEGVAFPTMWFDMPPIKKAPQVWESWAIGNNATILAANIQLPGYFAVGSGIFTGRDGPIAYTYNPDGTSKLVVANVPRLGRRSDIPKGTSITAITDHGTWNYTEDGQNVPYHCSYNLLNNTQDPRTDFRCYERNISKFTVVKLQEPRGVVTACSNGMCCSLTYSTSNLTETFFLGVFNGTYDFFERYSWCEETCFVARCDPSKEHDCALFPMKSETTFKHFRLETNVTTDFVFPSVISNDVRVVPRELWNFNKQGGNVALQLSGNGGHRLLVAGLRGRCYRKDPPYIR